MSERVIGNDPPRPLPLAEMLAAERARANALETERVAATARADEAERERDAARRDFNTLAESVRMSWQTDARQDRDDAFRERDEARAALAAAEDRERALREAGERLRLALGEALTRGWPPERWRDALREWDALAQPAPSPGAAEAGTCDRCHEPADDPTTALGTHEDGPATTCEPVRLCPACVRAITGEGAPDGD